MCLNPIQIKSSKSSWLRGRDKQFVSVPCNDCLECRLQKQNEYYVRLYYEWQRYYFNKGSVFFITNSYNEESLPFTPPVGSVDEVIVNNILGCKGLHLDYHSLPAFDKKHIRDFLERLHHLDRLPDVITKGFHYFKNGKIQKSCFCDDDGVLRNSVLGNEIKHFVVCEFGTQFKRPHYHLLIFFPFIVSASDFKRLCEFAWCDLVKEDDVPTYVRKCWLNCDKDFLHLQDWFIYKTGTLHKKTYYMHKKGFVMFSKKGAQILRPKAMKYLTKYIFKDQEYLNVPYIPEFIDLVKELPALNGLDSQFKRTVQKYKYSIPFFLVSKELGIKFEEEIDISSLDGAKSFVEREITFDNDVTVYAVPKYFVRRLCYQNKHYVHYLDDKRSVTLSYLTEFGKNVMKYKFLKSVNEYVQKIIMVSSNAFRSQLLPIDYIENGDVPFNLQKFYELLYDKFMRIDVLRLVSVYRLVYKDVHCVDWKEQVNNISVDYWLNRANDMFICQLNAKNEYKHELVGKYCIPHYSDVSTSNSELYNTLQVFDFFDEVIYKVDFLDNLVRNRKYIDSAKKYEVNRKYRQTYAKFIYNVVF